MKIKKLITYFAALMSIVVMVVLTLPTILHKNGLHPEYLGPSVNLPGRRALVITTSHAVLSKPGEFTGKATGVFSSEMTHPYYTFLDGGMEVDIASIKGGEIPIDPESFSFMIKTPEDERYLNDSIAQAKVKNSIPIEEVDPDEYDIIFISGGWGAAYDLAQSPVLASKISKAYYSKKNPIIGGVCHGVLGLVNATDSYGNLLIAGRRMTGVTNKQLRELGIEFTPKHPEEELRRAGVVFESKTAFRDFLATHVTIDNEQRFVTGQNQNSGLEAAHTMMGIIDKRT